MHFIKVPVQICQNMQDFVLLRGAYIICMKDGTMVRNKKMIVNGKAYLLMVTTVNVTNLMFR